MKKVGTPIYNIWIYTNIYMNIFKLKKAIFFYIESFISLKTDVVKGLKCANTTTGSYN